MLCSPFGTDMHWRDRSYVALARLVGTRGAILCFHGIASETSRSGIAMHIRLEHLQEIVTAMRQIGRLVPLREVMERSLSGYSASGLVALTADDAYVSWLEAESYLVRERIPLTLFAVGNALDSGSRFWWDRVEDAASMARPDIWQGFLDACGVPETFRLGHAASGDSLRALRQWVLAEKAGRWPVQLEEPLHQLEDELSLVASQRSMTHGELSDFLKRTGTELGVHTASHPALPLLPDNEVLMEIRQGHEMLRSAGDVLPYLAIPYGLYNARVLRLAAQAGMKASLTLAGSPVSLRPIPLHGVPRVCVVRQHGPGRLALKMSRLSTSVDYILGRETVAYPLLPSATT